MLTFKIMIVPDKIMIVPDRIVTCNLCWPAGQRIPSAKSFSATSGLGVFIKRRQKEFEGGF